MAYQGTLDDKSHLFDEKKNVLAVIAGLFIVCGLLMAADCIFIADGFDKHAYYAWENWPGFYAIFGFVSCVLLVLVSKLVLRPLVKRGEDYYGDD